MVVASGLSKRFFGSHWTLDLCLTKSRGFQGAEPPDGLRFTHKFCHRTGDSRGEAASDGATRRLRRGMTLVELLVVLAILALLTTVAVTSSDVFLSQGRYESTTQTLTNIQEAVLGPPNARQSDGTVVVSGFVADVGRAPVCTSADPTLGLSELWAQPANVPLFALGQSQNDPEVFVPCGWRGPYLRLAPGQTSIRDGWGNPMNLFSDTTGDLAGVGTSILVVSSNGAGSSPGSPYNAPLTANIGPSPIVVGGIAVNGIAVSGTVSVVDSNGNAVNASGTQIQVWMYFPDPTRKSGFRELQCIVTPGSVGTFSYLSYSVPTDVQAVCAPGFIRAYSPDRTILPTTPPTYTPRSSIVRFQRSGVINLTIQQSSSGTQSVVPSAQSLRQSGNPRMQSGGFSNPIPNP